MTNVNSPSEVLCRSFTRRGPFSPTEGLRNRYPSFSAPAESPLTSGRAGSSARYDDLAARYRNFMPAGSTWPQGQGGSSPQALLLTSSPLSEEAKTFVRTWFENSRVGLNLASDFFIQPVPALTGGPPPYHAMAKDLCQLLNPKALLSLGPLPAQRLLGAPLSLDTLRESDYRFDRWSIITTLDPEEYLGLEEAEKTRFKAQVWRDPSAASRQNQVWLIR